MYREAELLLPTRQHGVRMGKEIDRGLGAFPPGTPAHFHAVGHLFFPSMADLQRAMGETAPQLIADQRKYFSGESIVQINEVVTT